MPQLGVLDQTAFTAIADGKLSEIVVLIKVSLPYLPGGNPNPEPTPLDARALWDTGATNCAIIKTLVDRLGLPKVGKAMVSHADGESTQDVYLLNLYLPNRLMIPMIRATECKSARGNFDFIIGMDVIALGDFALTHADGKSCVSFIVPPSRKIDYVNEIEQMKLARASSGGKIGRNGPCFCGSGKKYKNCHGH